MQPSTNSPSAKITPPSITRNSATAIAGPATSSRAPRSEVRSLRPRSPLAPSEPRGRRPRGGRRVCAPPAISCDSSRTEAPAAAGELGERLFERIAREVRPELVAEDELCVGRLPQQVVRQALLSARADDQVRVVHLGRVQAGAEILLRA